MNSSQTTQIPSGPQLALEPRHSGPEQLLSFALWFPALATSVTLSIHRVLTCQSNGPAFRIIAFASFFVLLIHVGRRSEIWETQP
jgi:hypothetical protein